MNVYRGRGPMKVWLAAIFNKQVEGREGIKWTEADKLIRLDKTK